MKKKMLYSGIGALAILLVFTSFALRKKIPAERKAVVALVVQNNTTSKTITVVTAGPTSSPNTFTSLSILPGTSQTFYVIDWSGPTTVSVSCSSAWTGTLQYAEDYLTDVWGCNNTGTGATHSLTCTGNNAVYHYVQIFSSTAECP